MPIFNGGGGGDDTLIEDGTNFFQLGEPRIRNFENVERPEDLDPVDPDPVDPDPVPVTFAIGDTGPGGGIVFEVNEAGTAGLEVSSNVVGSNLQYGCFGISLVDTTQFTVDDDAGRQAIPGDEMRVLFDNANCISPAAEATFAFTTDQADDWYLPSANELVALLTALTPDQLPRAETPGYWSASEDTAQNAFLVFELPNGTFDVSPNSKESQSSILAVRTFGTNAN